ncbi:hypothetical protein [Streptomyces sp. NPDC001948]
MAKKTKQNRASKHVKQAKQRKAAASRNAAAVAASMADLPQSTSESGFGDTATRPLLQAPPGLPGPSDKISEDQTEYDYFSPYPNEGPAHSPNCTQCSDARPELEKIRDFSLTQRERFADRTLHPYVAGKTSLHRSSCTTVEDLAKQGRPLPWDERTESEADVFERELLGFAHAGSLSAYRPNFTVMTAQEAAGWVRARTGPRGGSRFRLCKVCTPGLPAGGA